MKEHRYKNEQKLIPIGPLNSFDNPNLRVIFTPKLLICIIRYCIFFVYPCLIMLMDGFYGFRHDMGVKFEIKLRVSRAQFQRCQELRFIAPSCHPDDFFGNENVSELSCISNFLDLASSDPEAVVLPQKLEKVFRDFNKVAQKLIQEGCISSSDCLFIPELPERAEPWTMVAIVNRLATYLQTSTGFTIVF